MAITLKEWLKDNHSDEDLQLLFYNMSSTLKYIHERDYFVKTFNTNEIQIVDDNKLSPIQYNTVVQIPKGENEEIKREDIYNLAFMQIGIYSNTLDILKPAFLKEHFDSFTAFLPAGDVPYYRGVATRGARVYYSDYVDEKNKREIAKLEEMTENEGYEKGIQRIKSTTAGKAFTDQANDYLYSDINKPEAAFTTLVIIPVIMIVIGVILSIIFLMN